MDKWIRTKTQPAPRDIPILLSDGEGIYLGAYDHLNDIFYCPLALYTIPGVKWWQPLPELPTEKLND